MFDVVRKKPEWQKHRTGTIRLNFFCKVETRGCSQILLKHSELTNISTLCYSKHNTYRKSHILNAFQEVH